MFAIRVQNVTRPEARSIEAKAKIQKKKKQSSKDSAEGKWLRVIKELMKPFPHAILNETVESIRDLEARDPKCIKRLQKQGK